MPSQLRSFKEYINCNAVHFAHSTLKKTWSSIQLHVYMYNLVMRFDPDLVVVDHANFNSNIGTP